MRKQLLSMILALTIISCLVWIPFAGGEECGIDTAASCKPETVITETPYQTEYRSDPDRYPESGNIVIQEGVDGKTVVTYLITYENGIETGRTLRGEEVTEPVTEIISVPSREHVIEAREETQTEAVHFTTKTVDDPDRPKGDPDLIRQEGKDSVRTIVYTVTYTDGAETDRTVKSDTVTEEPVEQIISVAAGEFTVSYVTQTEEIPFETVYEDSPNWCVGEEGVGIEGKNGQKEVTYEIRTGYDGKEISRKVSSEKITKNAVNQVIYRGTFVPVVTYEIVPLPDLPECEPARRNTKLDDDCIEWAMKMAQEDKVQHSNLGFGESVGGWGSVDEVVYGRDYSVISTQDGQLYNGIVSLGSHGGAGLKYGTIWGAGCVARTESQPDGSTVTVYFACARSED